MGRNKLRFAFVQACTDQFEQRSSLRNQHPTLYEKIDAAVKYQPWFEMYPGHRCDLRTQRRFCSRIKGTLLHEHR